jgi:Protein of unknown function (DUF2934)
MRDCLILLIHLIVTVVRLARPGGLRSVLARVAARQTSTSEMHSRTQRVCRRSYFSLTSQKKKRTAHRRRRKSVSGPLKIHIECGGIHGCDLDDWLQAERELQEKYKNNEKRTKKN